MLFYNHRAFFTIIVKSPTKCTIYLKKTLYGSLKYFSKTLRMFRLSHEAILRGVRKLVCIKHVYTLVIV
jgi:hypothetical protein